MRTDWAGKKQKHVTTPLHFRGDFNERIRQGHCSANDLLGGQSWSLPCAGQLRPDSVSVQFIEWELIERNKHRNVTAPLNFLGDFNERIRQEHCSANDLLGRQSWSLPCAGQLRPDSASVQFMEWELIERNKHRNVTAPLNFLGDFNERIRQEHCSANDLLGGQSWSLPCAGQLRPDSVSEQFMEWELIERKETETRHNATTFPRRLQWADKTGALQC